MNNNFSKILITNPERLAEARAAIRRDGVDKLQIVSDFDRTLTTCFVNGEKVVSLIAVLRDEKYLTPDYPAKAQALFDHYHSLEIDPTISLEEKRRLMHEWWSAHYELLIASGLMRDDLKQAARSERISFRPGVLEFLDHLAAREIPLLIFSSSGLGAENIDFYLERFNKKLPNIQVISNTLLWDENGQAIGVREPLIHTFNKDFSVVKNSPFYAKIKERKNIILLGDSLGDAAMADGAGAENIIKIGFLNENIDKDLSAYQEKYDIVITADGPLDYVNSLLKEII
jgi:5'-nucleotidase